MTDVAAHPHDATTGIATATGLGGESTGCSTADSRQADPDCRLRPSITTGAEAEPPLLASRFSVSGSRLSAFLVYNTAQEERQG